MGGWDEEREAEEGGLNLQIENAGEEEWAKEGVEKKED